MRVNVITCTWNSADWLSDCIGSVTAQTHADLEQIFIDGGSTDGTLEMISRLSPGSHIEHDVTGGISKAMNRGIEVATGDAIIHLHSDDFFSSPLSLATAVDALDKTGAEWCTGRMERLVDGSRVSAPPREQAFSYSRFAAACFAVDHPATLIRRRLFEEYGMFDTRLKYAMDIDFWLRIGKLHNPAVVDEVLTVFRMHAGSLSSANAEMARREEIHVRLRHLGQSPLASAEGVARVYARLRRLRRRRDV